MQGATGSLTDHLLAGDGGIACKKAFPEANGSPVHDPRDYASPCKVR